MEIEKLFSYIGWKMNVIFLFSFLILKFFVFWCFNLIYECVIYIGWIFNVYLGFFYEKIVWNIEGENVYFKLIYGGDVIGFF